MNFQEIYQQNGTDLSNVSLSPSEGRAYLTYVQAREGMQTRLKDATVVAPMSHEDAMTEVQKYHR